MSSLWSLNPDEQFKIYFLPFVSWHNEGGGLKSCCCLGEVKAGGGRERMGQSGGRGGVASKEPTVV